MAIVLKTNSCRADVILPNFPNSVMMDILYSADSQGRGIAKRESLTAVVMALTDFDIDHVDINLRLLFGHREDTIFSSRLNQGTFLLILCVSSLIRTFKLLHNPSLVLTF